MSSPNCFEKIRDEFKDIFDDQTLRSSMQSLQNAMEDARAKGLDLHAELKRKGTDIMNDKEADLQMKEFRFYREKERLLNDMKNAQPFLKRSKGIFQWIKSKITGTETGVKGSRLNTETKILQGIHRGLGKFTQELEKRNLMPLFNARENEVELFQALQRESIKNPQIQEIADVFHSIMDKEEELLKREGFFRKYKLADRALYQFHSQSELLKTHDTFQASQLWHEEGIPFGQKLADEIAQRVKNVKHTITGVKTPAVRFEKAFQRWLNYIHPSEEGSRLDIKRTFGEYDADTYSKQVQFLREAFRSLTNDGKLFVENENLESRLEHRRILHFTDAETAVQYNRKFGFGTVPDAMLHEMESTIRNRTLVQDWGFNPTSYLGKLIQMGEKDEKFRFRVGAGKEQVLLKRYLDDIQGNLTNSRSLGARIGANIRSFINFHLGSVIFTALTDYGPAAEEMNRAMGNYGRGAVQLVKNMFSHIPAFQNEEMHALETRLGARPHDATFREIFGSMFKANTNNQMGAMTRFTGIADQPGKLMSNLQRLFFKAGMLQWHDNSVRGGLAGALAHHLALNKDIPFQALTEADRRILASYNIDDYWDLLRKTPTKEIDGLHYISPENAQAIDDQSIIEYLHQHGVQRVNKGRIQDVRDELENSLGTYFEDRMNHAILRPSAADRQFFLRGQPSGTLYGEIARFIAQFKMYPLTFLTRSFASKIYGQGAENFYNAMVKGQADYHGLLRMSAALLFLGAAANAASSLSNNETPLDPMSPNGFKQMFDRSGVGGLLGDLLMRDPNQYGRPGIGDELAGPALGDMGNITNFLVGALHGDATTKQAFNLIKNNIGPLRLFWTKMPVDYLLAHLLGQNGRQNYWMNRRNQLLQNGQDFAFYNPGT